jgi:hypothetical protein
MVQEYQERFNVLLCHTPNLSQAQKADQFVGGLPEHIRIEVKLRDPRDLQTTKHLTQVYECRAEATPPAPAQRLAQPPQLLALALPPTAHMAANTLGALATPTHVLLTPERSLFGFSN